MIFRSPIGSSVYFVLVFIGFPSFSPISCTIDANNVATICKPDGQNTFSDTSHAVIPAFFGTMCGVFRNNTVGIKKCLLCSQKRNAVLGLVFFILFLVPLKFCFSHKYIISKTCVNRQYICMVNYMGMSIFLHNDEFARASTVSGATACYAIISFRPSIICVNCSIDTLPITFPILSTERVRI